jgi:AraC family transcriptional regulator
VAELAEVAGLSPYHFSRLFTARFGESVMGYVRGCRLNVAALRLAGSAPPPLTELAFDCGFESQEAFTRAFRRRFGTPPGQFRRATQRPIEETAMSDAKSPVEMLKDLVRRDAFTVAGPRAVFDDDNKHGIPALWPRLIKCLPLQGQVDARTYGVCWMADRAEGSINYMAGVEVKGDAALPEGLERIAIPARSYAVFRLNLDGSALHPQMQAAMPEIWGHLIPESGLRLVPSPDFELYPADFNPNVKGMHVDVYVPVER